MFDYTKSVKFSFDTSNRILHKQFTRLIHLETENQLHAYMAYCFDYIEQLISGGRIYFVINLKNLIIDPALNQLYGKYINEMYQKYLIPDGVARYGNQITRLTIKIGHEKINKPQPDIFPGEKEAFDYIHAQIAKNSSVPVK